MVASLGPSLALREAELLRLLDEPYGGHSADRSPSRKAQRAKRNVRQDSIVPSRADPLRPEVLGKDRDSHLARHPPDDHGGSA